MFPLNEKISMNYYTRITLIPIAVKYYTRITLIPIAVKYYTRITLIPIVVSVTISLLNHIINNLNKSTHYFRHSSLSF